MKYCLNCGAELTSQQKSNRYCSSQCYSDFQYKKYIQDWKAGRKNGTKGKYQVSNYVKRYLLEKNNHQCSSCGWGEINVFTKNIPLEIEHIDGNYRNNAEENLTILCPNCHSLTSTYKGANKGKGREDRKKYYKKS